MWFNNTSGGNQVANSQTSPSPANSAASSSRSPIGGGGESSEASSGWSQNPTPELENSSAIINSETNNNNGHPNKHTKTAGHTVQLATASQTLPKQQSSDVPGKISFHLKTSIFTRRVTIDSDKMALGLIKQLAIAFLNELYFQHPLPTNTYLGDYLAKHFATADNLQSLYNRLVLRKYNCQQESFLPFNSVSDIEPESYISIEVSEKFHLLSCASPIATSTSASSNSSTSNATTTTSTSSSGTALSSNHQQSSQQATVKMSHEFKTESYLFMTHCASCSSLIGAFRQGYQCTWCKRNFCPKCKVKAETSGDSCLAPANLNQQHHHQPSSAAGAQLASQTSAQQSASGQNASGGQLQVSGNQATSNDAIGNNLLIGAAGKIADAHSNMSKRRSASNLLHFNIANPFKSHHGQQQQQQQQATGGGISQQTIKEDKPKLRGSAGALDPVLQQLGKLKEQLPTPLHLAQTNEQQQQQQQVSGKKLSGTNNLIVAQQAQISSSHQNLFTDRDGFTVPDGGAIAADDEVSAAGSLSVHQSPINLASRAHVNQLSNSARTSAHDLRATSPTSKPTRDHLFISMDWIQISGEPQCGVCSKVLRSQPQQSITSYSAPSMCKNCKLQVHSHCQDLILTDCMSRIAESSRAAAERQESGKNSANKATEKTSVKNTNSNVSRDNIRLRRLVPSVKHVKRPDATKPIIEGWLKHTTLSDEQARQHYWRLDETDITLYENDTSRRYFQAIALNKITRVMSSQSIPKRVKEDVLTTRVPELAAAAAAAGSEKQTAKSANTSPMKSPQLKAQMNAIFAFELASGSMYLVQANSESEASKWLESLAAITSAQKKQQQEAPPASPGIVTSNTANETTMKQKQPETVKKLVEFVNDLCIDKEREAAAAALDKDSTQSSSPIMPQKDGEKKVEVPKEIEPQQQQQRQMMPSPRQPEKQVAASKLETPARQISNQRHHHNFPSGGIHRSGGGVQPNQKSYTDPSRSRLYNRPRITIQINPMSIPDHWIVGKYLIERDRNKGCGFEELGSGQFGKVYAAISEIKAEDSSKGIWSGVPVAIKEISKARFDLRQQAKLKNEANILSQLDHPGVIILERVHDLPDKIYIVMEQLEDDMLEMIVSTDEKRLSERITKFLTYQILEALKYLHQKHIAHCDLKPENVLLVERRSQFPQIKLCDFGFAKIIEDNSFRSSLVGTPAYLAPEVVKGERYNRSVDLWSVGVIVYVSLSGEFPFNEGESIHDQISRANFMYPKNPWDGISNQAKSFINSLLRVNCEKRLSASRAQMDDWIQDYQLWCDLTELEVRVGRRWVTDDADFERWSRYARERNLQLPRTAIQLHENLLND